MDLIAYGRRRQAMNAGYFGSSFGAGGRSRSTLDVATSESDRKSDAGSDRSARSTRSYRSWMREKERKLRKRSAVHEGAIGLGYGKQLEVDPHREIDIFSFTRRRMTPIHSVESTRAPSRADSSPNDQSSDIGVINTNSRTSSMTSSVDSRRKRFADDDDDVMESSISRRSFDPFYSSGSSSVTSSDDDEPLAMTSQAMTSNWLRSKLLPEAADDETTSRRVRGKLIAKSDHSSVQQTQLPLLRQPSVGGLNELQMILSDSDESDSDVFRNDQEQPKSPISSLDVSLALPGGGNVVNICGVSPADDDTSQPQATEVDAECPTAECPTEYTQLLTDGCMSENLENRQSIGTNFVPSSHDENDKLLQILKPQQSTSNRVPQDIELGATTGPAVEKQENRNGESEPASCSARGKSASVSANQPEIAKKAVESAPASAESKTKEKENVKVPKLRRRRTIPSMDVIDSEFRCCEICCVS